MPFMPSCAKRNTRRTTSLLLNRQNDMPKVVTDIKIEFSIVAGASPKSVVTLGSQKICAARRQECQKQCSHTMYAQALVDQFDRTRANACFELCQSCSEGLQ